MRDLGHIEYENAVAALREAEETRKHRRLTFEEAAEAARAWIEVRVAEDREKLARRERYERKKASKARFWHARRG